MSGVSGSGESLVDELTEQTGISYDSATGGVEFTDVSSDTEQYVTLVEFLIENECITGSDLPISAKYAQTRYLINSTASHEHREMIRPREIGDGIYVETNHDSSSKARYSARFIENYVLRE
jgi:hypothetical protein